MDTSDIINIVLGIYGAFITTYIYKMSLREKKRRLVFSHEFVLTNNPDNLICPMLLLRVNNGGEKNIDLIEVGFTSKSGRVVIKKETPRIATIGPGESYSVSVNIKEHIKELNIITGYYAKDSFGDEHKFSLLAPLPEQIKNTALLKALYDFGYTNEVSWDGFNKAITENNNKVDKLKNDLEVMAQTWEKEDEELYKKHEEWDRYEKETGKQHPEREEYLKRIMESIKLDKSNNMT